MYEYIKGIIEEVMSNAIALDNNGVGYLIYTPDSYYYKVGEKYKVYIYDL